MFLFGLVMLSTVRVNIAKTTPTDMEYGVNYLSTWWHYEPKYLSDQELDNDFRLFSDNSLKYVTLVVVWKYIEPALGNYNHTALDDLKRVCQFAAQHGLQAIIDFHTMMQENTFTMPTWLSPRKFETVLKNTTAKQAWLNFLDHTVSYLSTIENIHSWHMMNEPARGSWACNVTVDDFVNLWSEMRSIFKSHSTKPVSIRFAAGTFDTHFNRDQRIYEVCDYVALNWYENLYSPEHLTALVTEIRQHRTVMISEFGYDEIDDDILQAEAYRGYVELFKKIGVSVCIAWLWRADHDQGSPDPPGTGFNLAKNVTTENAHPRTAFCLLKTTEHDLGITAMTTSKTVIGQGYSLNVNVGIADYGTDNETFTLEVYANSSIIKTFQNIKLESGNSTNVTCTWDTSGFEKGQYILSAYIQPIQGETVVFDNRRASNTIRVTILGDVDGDSDVDILDVVRIAVVYGLRMGDLKFDANSDLDNDGSINVIDLVICTVHYHPSYP